MGGFIMAPAKHARVWPGAQSEPTALRLSQFFRVAMGDSELSKFEGNTWEILCIPMAYGGENEFLRLGQTLGWIPHSWTNPYDRIKQNMRNMKQEWFGHS